jgi:hypothetical protein
MRKRLIAIAMLVYLMTATGGASAHHAFASVFNPDRALDITGSVTKVEWMNPHIWFYLDIENEDGTVENWGFEMGSPNSLVRRGWSHDSLQVGDVVSIVGWRARDGSLRGAVKTIVLASGEQLFGGQNTSR